jgi:CheY-like chemotaxis protein
MLLAMDLEAILEEAGCDVIGSIPDVRRVLDRLPEQRPEVVLLDMNLNGESSAPIAAALKQDDIPFLVVTGYNGKNASEPLFRDAPVIKKPYDGNQLLRALCKLLA